MKKEELIEYIISALPCGEQCRAWDLDSEVSALRLTWRGTRFRVSDSGIVEVVGDGILKCSNEAILATALIRSAIFNHSKNGRKQ